MREAESTKEQPVQPELPRQMDSVRGEVRRDSFSEPQKKQRSGVYKCSNAQARRSWRSQYKGAVQLGLAPPHRNDIDCGPLCEVMARDDKPKVSSLAPRSSHLS